MHHLRYRGCQLLPTHFGGVRGEHARHVEVGEISVAQHADETILATTGMCRISSSRMRSQASAMRACGATVTGFGVMRSRALIIPLLSDSTFPESNRGARRKGNMRQVL